MDGREHKQSKGRRGRKPIVIGVVVAVLVLTAAAGVWAWTTQHKAEVAKKAAPPSVNQATLALDTRSNDVKIAAQQADTQAGTGDTAGAAQTLNAAMKTTNDPDEKVSLYLQLAAIYANAGQRDQAVTADTAALDLRPNAWYIYRALGDVYVQSNDVSDAKASYQKALDALKGDTANTMYYNEIQNTLNSLGNT